MDSIQEKEKNIIQDKYNLIYYKNNNFDGFEGNLTIFNGDVYHISINLKRPYNLLPIVKELNERIPRKLDRHIYKDGTCCLTTAAKGNFLLKTEIKTIIDFIDKIIIPFFKNNSYYEINKKYVNDEYKHGINGVIQFYKEISNIDDIFILINFIFNIFNKKKQERNDLCFCKSGKKFKKCHMKNFEDISIIDKDIIKDDLLKIIKICECNLPLLFPKSH